ncbi:MAG: LUD domain-containing protein [Alphaproteobacteria bacterium]|nr:LUD domain-containing protein [Alphaproteobacteria bacterium]
MSAARDQILGHIRRSLGRGEGAEAAAAREAVDARLTERPRGLIPERARTPDPDALVALFQEKAARVDCTTQVIASLDELPDAVADYLARENLPAELRMGAHPDLTAAPWDSRPTLSVSTGPTDGSHAVSVAAAFAGAAETATLALLSGPDAPTTLNFLPESEIVLLRKSRLVGPYEDVWRLLRARNEEAGGLPRTVNLITGPSRTGDIEQTIELGAHGPLRLHVVILDDV